MTTSLRDLPGAITLASPGSPARKADAAVAARITELRHELARQWLGLPAADWERAYSSDLGHALRQLRAGPMRTTAQSESERMLVGELRQRLEQRRGEPDTAALLCAMLYFEPHELPHLVPFETVPPWLLEDYARFMLTPPELFRYAGEADAHAAHTRRWIGYLHRGIVGNPTHRFWAGIRDFVAKSLNFVSLYFNDANLRDVYRQRAEIIEVMLRAAGHMLDYQFPPRASRPRLRVGILAAHFAPQTETFATLPVYEHLDRSVFEIVLLAPHVSSSPLELYCQTRADRFVRLPDALPRQVQAIREADLDFLLVATNVTAVTSTIALLAMHRLARVQVTLVPSCTTSGMRHMDYYLSGSLSEPAEGAQQHYTEKLRLIDGPAHCYDFGPEAVSAAQVERRRSEPGPDAVVFASGANFYKIIPEVEDVWLRILERTPGSQLLLYPFNPNWSNNYPVQKFVERLQAAALAHGIAADRLVVLMPAPGRADVLARLGMADVYLDSFPFSGATSLLDPLEVGLPTVVMDGKTFRALVGPALLRSLKLPDLIASTTEEYVEIACRLARDSGYRVQVRERTAAAMRANPPFLDPRWYGGEVQKALLAMWEEAGARVPASH